MRVALLFCAAAVAAARAAPTWSADIAPILYQNCVECHQRGQVAPFPLLSYADAAKRARFIARTVKSRVMPPWLPSGPAGAFVGERLLTADQVSAIADWAAAGAPEGDVSRAPAPPAPQSDGWRLGPPDLVVRMRAPFAVPAGPDDTYEVFPMHFSLAQVPPEVLAAARIPDSDVLAVAAVEVRPGNRRVLHHADVFVDTSGEAMRREKEEGGLGYRNFGTPGFVPAAYLGGRVPGMEPRFLPHGIAASVMPLSGDIALQVHYKATGKPETDQTEVGIHFMREPTRRVLDTLFLRSFNLHIPPGDPAYVVTDSIEIPADVVLMSVFAHMHMTGKEVHASARLPDGTSRDLLDIQRWSFTWQDRYYYHEPFILPKGTVVTCRWTFDNGASNPANPFSPPREILFGPNSTDEMCELQLGLIPVNIGDDTLLLQARVRKMKEKIGELSPADRARFRWQDALNDLSGRGE
ncbi:MAG TPA: cytochrome c [Opitutaceae bacterium]|jgi:mono/diheme cytochrome c family protein